MADLTKAVGRSHALAPYQVARPKALKMKRRIQQRKDLAFDPDEPRDEGGRWTGPGASEAPKSIRDIGKPKSILDLPRAPQSVAPDKWADFKPVHEAAQRLAKMQYKGTPITAEHGFTFEAQSRGRILVKKDGKPLGTSKFVWTKNGPQFNVGGWFTYQHYPTYHDVLEDRLDLEREYVRDDKGQFAETGADDGLGTITTTLAPATVERLSRRLANGVEVFRGVKAEGRAPADTGDFGIGTYHSSSAARASNYGKLTKVTLTLKHPLVLTANEAYDQLTHVHDTVTAPQAERQANSALLTRKLQARGYDGLAVVNTTSKFGEVEYVKFPEHVHLADREYVRDDQGRFAETEGGSSELTARDRARDQKFKTDMARLAAKVRAETAREKDVASRPPVPYVHNQATHENVEGRLKDLVPKVYVSQKKQTAITAASHVAEVLEQMHAQGYAMPASVTVQLGTKHSLYGVISHRRGEEHLTVEVPGDLPANANLDHAAFIAFGGTATADGTPGGSYDRFVARSMNDVVLHEMGHVQAPERLRTTTKAEKEAMRLVSLYAATDSHEFVAEAFLRLSRGETLPEASAKLYKDLGGPAVKKAKR